MSFDLFETLDPFLISPEEKLFLSPGIAPQEAKLNVLFKLYVQLRNTKRILISIRKQCKQILVQIFFIRLPLGRQQNQKRKDRLCGWRKKMFRVSLQTFRPCLLSLSLTHTIHLGTNPLHTFTTKSSSNGYFVSPQKTHFRE